MVTAVTAPPLDMDAVRRQVQDGYISVRQHPNADLFIWNYTKKAQFDGYWTPETTQCRGLITDGADRIVQRCLKKFFNLEEHRDPLPVEPFEVYDKLDGSYAVLYWVGDTPSIASRGSFLSDQALWGTDILHATYPHTFNGLDRSLSYIFELLHPSNRIVVDYGDRKDLVLLATIHTATGAEIPLSEAWGFPLVTRYDGIRDLGELTARQDANREGYVVRFASGLRVKVKFDEYVRLHRLVTGVNERHIWECLRDGDDVSDLMNGAPPAYQRWVNTVATDLRQRYGAIQRECLTAYAFLDVTGDRKSIAMQIVRFTPTLQHVLFALLDGHAYNDIIWKALKPTHAAPFKADDT